MSPATETAGLKIRKLPHNRQNGLRPPCLHDSEEAHTMPSNKTPLSETTDNALADFPALQDLFEQADEDLRTFYEALSVRLNDYALIDGALSASPAAAPQIPRFLELLDRDVAAFRRAEPAATVLSLRALYGRRIGAVGGGVSCGKTAFINSLLTNASCRLAEDEQPVTVLPCHVIAGSDVEKAVARGVSRWGGIFEMPVETCLNLSYSALRSRDFSLLKIMRGMTLLTPVRDRLFRHLCLMDTPGYNPPETCGEADARNTAPSTLAFSVQSRAPLSTTVTLAFFTSSRSRVSRTVARIFLPY